VQHVGSRARPPAQHDRQPSRTGTRWSSGRLLSAGTQPRPDTYRPARSVPRVSSPAHVCQHGDFRPSELSWSARLHRGDPPRPPPRVRLGGGGIGDDRGLPGRPGPPSTPIRQRARQPRRAPRSIRPSGDTAGRPAAGSLRSRYGRHRPPAPWVNAQRRLGGTGTCRCRAARCSQQRRRGGRAADHPPASGRRASDGQVSTAWRNTLGAGPPFR